MIIKINETGETKEVYSVYFINNKIYFLSFAKKNKGLIAYKLENVELVDKTINNDFVFNIDKNFDIGVYHKLLLEDNMLEKLLENDEKAYDLFFEKIRP